MRTKLTLVVILAAVSIAGCGTHTPTSPDKPMNGLPSAFYALWDSSFDGAEFLFSLGGADNSQLVTVDADGTPVAAVFIKVGSRYVNAGRVHVGQTPPISAAVDTLARRSVPVYGTPWYLYTSVPNLPALPPIIFDGVVRHHFLLTGSTDLGAFEDSILSVRRPVISFPAAGAAVVRDSDLIVRWSDAGTDTSVHVVGFVHSNVDSSIAPGVGDARDPDGQATVDFVLANLPAGSARLIVIRYRVVHRTIGPVPVELKCEGVVHRMLTLK